MPQGRSTTTHTREPTHPTQAPNNPRQGKDTRTQTGKHLATSNKQQAQVPTQSPKHRNTEPTPDRETSQGMPQRLIANPKTVRKAAAAFEGKLSVGHFQEYLNGRYTCRALHPLAKHREVPTSLESNPNSLVPARSSLYRAQWLSPQANLPPTAKLLYYAYSPPETIYYSTSAAAFSMASASSSSAILAFNSASVLTSWALKSASVFSHCFFFSSKSLHLA